MDIHEEKRLIGRMLEKAKDEPEAEEGPGPGSWNTWWEEQERLENLPPEPQAKPEPEQEPEPEPEEPKPGSVKGAKLGTVGDMVNTLLKIKPMAKFKVGITDGGVTRSYDVVDVRVFNLGGEQGRQAIFYVEPESQG